MTNQEVIEDIIKQFPDDVSDVYEPHGLLTFNSTREQIIPLLEYLHHHPIFQFQFLTDLCGIHYPHQKGAELGVIYHVHSLIHNVRIRIKVFFPVADPRIPSATVLYQTANWMERETYDFYGILFTGHSNLIRILNVDDMDYFPMRKEYPLEDAPRRDKEDEKFGR